MRIFSVGLGALLFALSSFADAQHRSNLEKSDRVTDTKNPFEGISRDRFHSRNRMRLIEANDGLPIVRRPKRQLEVNSIRTIGLWTSLSQLRRSPLETFSESFVESSKRRKPSGPRDCHNRHSGLDDQLAREIEPVRVGDLLGRLSDFFFKESPQMPCAYAQPCGESVLACLIKLISGDELKRPLHDRFLSPPRRRERGTFGTAPQTRSVSRQLRRGGIGEELNVLALRSGWTNGPAVNTSSFHRNEEFAVEAAVSCEHSVIKIVHRDHSIEANEAWAQGAD